MAKAARSIGLGAVGACGVLGLAAAMVVNPFAATSSAAAALTPFDDCSDLQHSYARAALPLVTPWGLQGMGWGGPVYAMGMRADTAVPAPGAETSSPRDAVGNGDTGTNVQEQGVDEPDIAKTNGQIVVTLSGRSLHIFNVTGSSPRELGTLRLPGSTRPTDLLLIGDRVLVISDGSMFGAWPTPAFAVDDAPPLASAAAPAEDEMGGDQAVASRVIAPFQWQRSVITTVDISDPNEPMVTDHQVVDGQVVDARETGGIVRVVISHQPALKFVAPNRRLTEDEALVRNRQIVQAADATDWLPTSTRAGVTTPLVSCSNVLHPATDPSFPSTLTVLTVDPSAPTVPNSVGLIAGGDTVYASADRLYVTASSGTYFPMADTKSSQPSPISTSIHVFATTGDSTAYVASGEVKGTIPSRWALSEDQGVLRVASQVGNPWQPRETVVSTFREENNNLALMGSVGGMGKDEQIKSVRWFGDMAVVVTFRQTDPLYTLDLSNPEQPVVSGELKMPGFSSYLHPLGNDVLLGVGSSANRSGVVRGTQVSTFDLHDLSQPQRVDVATLGAHAYSSVADDAHTFTYLPEPRLALIPTTNYRGASRIAVVSLSPDGQLTLERSISMSRSWGQPRMLPLDDGRVVIVNDGHVDQIVTLAS